MALVFKGLPNASEVRAKLRNETRAAYMATLNEYFDSLLEINESLHKHFHYNFGCIKN